MRPGMFATVRDAALGIAAAIALGLLSWAGAIVLLCGAVRCT